MVLIKPEIFSRYQTFNSSAIQMRCEVVIVIDSEQYYSF
jgi:hypothetical protein